MSKTENLVVGPHAVAAMLARAREQIIELWVLQGYPANPRLAALVQEAKAAGLKVHEARREVLDHRVEPGMPHQGIIALIKPVPAYHEADLGALIARIPGPPLLLILDGVQDPHNLGACLRTADAAGVHAVIAPKDKAASLTATVRKVACGAAETVPFVAVTNLARTLRALKELGVWIAGAEVEAASSLYETDLTGPLAIVLGAEGVGLRRLTKEHCDYLVKIPMAGTVQSLNVSVSAGIFLFEVVRQRLAAPS